MENIKSQFLSIYCKQHSIQQSSIPINLDTYELDKYLLKHYGNSLLSVTFHNRLNIRHWARQYCPKNIKFNDILQLCKWGDFTNEEKNIIVYLFDFLLQTKGTKNDKNAVISTSKFILYLELGFTPFVIITASYNNEQYVSKYINSIKTQRYILYRIIYGDDSSCDQTLSKCRMDIDKNQLNNKCSIQSRSKRMYQAYTKHECYQQTDDDEVCVFLDGDDHFNNPCSLEIIHQVYHETGVEITTGSYCIHYNNEIVYLPNTIQPYNNPVFTKCVTQARDKREWSHSHLRTGRAKLFKSIPTSYLHDLNGNWLKFATDVTEMYWALDQCKTFVRIHNILLNYNKTNSIKYLNSYYNNSESNERKTIMEHIRLLPPATDILKDNTMTEPQIIIPTSLDIIKPILFKDLLPHTFVINLDRRPDRAKTMSNLCTKYNINARFLRAVDGYSADMQASYNKYLGYWSHSKKKYISKGALGLICTYIELLHHCLKYRFEYICIFEDDVRFHKKFDGHVNKIKELMDKFDIIYLGANQQNWSDININDDIYIVTGERKSWTYGMFSVVLNRRAMKKLYTHLTCCMYWQQEYPIDCVMNQLIKNTSLNACVMQPNIVIADLSDSDMQAPRDMEKWSRKLKWDLSDYNLLKKNDNVVVSINSYKK